MCFRARRLRTLDSSATRKFGTLTPTKPVQLGPTSTGVDTANHHRFGTFIGVLNSLSRDPFVIRYHYLPWSSIAYTVPAAFSMLLKLRYKLDSNPTLSAMLFKLKQLRLDPEPTLRDVFPLWSE